MPLSPLSTHLFSFGPQSAHAGGEGRVSSSKREAGDERSASEEPEGHVVEVTLSSAHLLQREPLQWRPAMEVAE